MRILSDSEIKVGKRVESLEFGDLLFRGKISEPNITQSGLIYGYAPNRDVVWADPNS